MQTQSLLLALLPFLVRLCQAKTDLLSYADELPQCGLDCLNEEVPKSICQSLSNATCVCTNRDLAASVKGCISYSCTKEETLALEQVTHEACGVSARRSRKNEFWGFVAVDVFTFICICLRIYGRWRVARKLEPEDYVMLTVLVLFIAFTTIGEYASLTAFGVDIWTLDRETITMALMFFYIEESLYLTLLALTKIAILCFYLRIFPNKSFRIAVWVTTGWVALATVVFVFLSIFQCSPINYNWMGWEGHITNYSCINIHNPSYAAASFSIAQEIMILALPLPLIIKLNTTKRKRAGIVVLFSLGVFVMITSCIRLRYLLTFARSPNPTWDYTNTVLWTVLEVNVSIIVASLPAIRQLLTQALPKVFGTAPLRSKRSSQTRSAELSTRGRARTGGTRLHNSRMPDMFTSWTARFNEDAGLRLELGDKSRGSIHTEIFADPARADEQFLHYAAERSSLDRRRIQVLTTISSDAVVYNRPDREVEDNTTGSATPERSPSMPKTGRSVKLWTPTRSESSGDKESG
ncbi:hypothetical protein F5Y19DRAFT_481583 [Xylariaceae sp. FL1651]|nr:hypothetical protein F5Y19DRAFT_481583 [Xylariaceae sp. FL1651]